MGIRGYTEGASDPQPNKQGRRLGFTEPNPSGRAAATAYRAVKRAGLFTHILVLDPILQ